MTSVRHEVRGDFLSLFWAKRRHRDSDLPTDHYEKNKQNNMFFLQICPGDVTHKKIQLCYY